MKRYPTPAAAVLALVIWAISPPDVHAGEVIWTATGSVTSAAASYGVTAGSPVTVRVSYQSEVQAKGLVGLFFPPSTIYAKTRFHGDVGLLTEVRIGNKVWQGFVASLAENSGDMLLTEAWDGGGTSDTFTILATSAVAGTRFDLFPYPGGQTARSIQIVLADKTSPATFISAGEMPTESALPSQITEAGGFVAAGTEKINFTLVPASVTVTSSPVRTSLTIQRTLGGVSLGWPSTAGTTYHLEESDGLGGWQSMGDYTGTGNDLVVPLNPFTDHPVRRFYRVGWQEVAEGNGIPTK